MSEHKNPIEQAMDVFVFAPLGLLFSARETIPALAKKGREYAQAAKTMGEFAIGHGRDQAGKAVRQAGDQASQSLSVVSNLSGRRPAASARAPRAPEPPPAPEAPRAPEPPAASESGVSSGGNGSTAVRPTAQHLAIPGYDTLSASQVVQRLEGLSADELEAVRAYEQDGRKRKTILTRVEQLQSGS